MEGDADAGLKVLKIHINNKVILMFDTVIKLPYPLCLLFSDFIQFFHFYSISCVCKLHPLTEFKVASLSFRT